ncbi:MAG: hypothetical protein RLZZ403_220 [Pseudomonadota bacterium]
MALEVTGIAVIGDTQSGTPCPLVAFRGVATTSRAADFPAWLILTSYGINTIYGPNGPYMALYMYFFG